MIIPALHSCTALTRKFCPLIIIVLLCTFHCCRKGDNEKYATDHSSVAKVVFSSPQFASVGLAEEEAVEQVMNVDVFTSEFTCASLASLLK